MAKNEPKKAFEQAAQALELKPLNRKNLQQAIDVAVGVFGEGDREAIEEEFKGSLGLTGTKVPFIESSQFFLASKNGQPVGVTGYYNVDGHKQDIWLNWMGVLPQFRGTGIGGTLVEQGFIQMAKGDIKTLRIWTTLEQDYANARKLYNKLGFTQEPYKPGAKDAAKLVVVFSKSVDPKAGNGYLWKNSAYRIDCESHVIPDLNKQLGLGKNKKPPKPQP